MFRRIRTFLAAPLLAAPVFAGGLGVGDPAPEIAVAEWIKGEPVASFESGQVYVVEFWATWCGPCRKSIPHLSELQKEYGEKVAFIGVSVWENDYDRVPPFVEKMGDQMAYRVATDLVEGGKGHMAKAWMEAAGQRGIPAAFVVDGERRIAWIGHPAKLDDPLAKIVAGEWDVDAAAKAREEERTRKAKNEAVMKRIAVAEQDEDWKGVLEGVDELMEMDPKAEAYLAPVRFQTLLLLGRFDEGFLYGRKVVEGVGRDSASTLNRIAWAIVDPKYDLAERDLDLALTAAQRANALVDVKEPAEKAAVLDTLARVHFQRGEIERAVEFQEQALELSVAADYPEEIQAEFRTRLEEYREAAKT